MYASLTTNVNRRVGLWANCLKKGVVFAEIASIAFELVCYGRSQMDHVSMSFGLVSMMHAEVRVLAFERANQSYVHLYKWVTFDSRLQFSGLQYNQESGDKMASSSNYELIWLS